VTIKDKEMTNVEMLRIFRAAVTALSKLPNNGIRVKARELRAFNENNECIQCEEFHPRNCGREFQLHQEVHSIVKEGC